MLGTRLQTIVVAVVFAGACIAGGAALLLPTTIFDSVLADFIGHPGRAATTSSQRLIAVAGAGLGAIALASAASGVKGRTLSIPPRRHLLAIALGGPFSLNVLELAHRLGVPRYIRLPRASHAVLPVAICVACTWFLARERRPRAGDLGLWVPAAVGAGYGCFSGLWHCCAPLWAYSSWRAPLWFVALALALGAVGRTAASARPGIGEALGGVVFGVTYPWHTALFFAQNLVAGALATALVRATGSGWAPAVFLGTAYLTHTTLPFLGELGVVVAAGLLVGCGALALRRTRAVRV